MEFASTVEDIWADIRALNPVPRMLVIVGLASLLGMGLVMAEVPYARLILLSVLMTHALDGIIVAVAAVVAWANDYRFSSTEVKWAWAVIFLIGSIITALAVEGSKLFGWADGLYEGLQWYGEAGIGFAAWYVALGVPAAVILAGNHE